MGGKSPNYLPGGVDWPFPAPPPSGVPTDWVLGFGRSRRMSRGLDAAVEGFCPVGSTGLDLSSGEGVMRPLTDGLTFGCNGGA